MWRTLIPTFAIVALGSLGSVASAFSTEVSFLTFDGVTVHGDLYEADAPEDAPIILLFHQGASNARGEYGDHIAPRLVEAGYHVLAIDQRNGGDTYGHTNRTIEGIEKNVNGRDARPAGYCDALPDLDGAVSFAREQGYTGKLAAWGSSYSAALVFHLAANRPDDVDAVLAFSPASGGPVLECQAEQAIGNVKAPMFAARPAIEMRRPTVQSQTNLFIEHDVYFMVAPRGVHGSSMLHPERAQMTDMVWGSVLAWLNYALRDGEKPEPQPRPKMPGR